MTRPRRMPTSAQFDSVKRIVTTEKDKGTQGIGTRAILILEHLYLALHYVPTTLVQVLLQLKKNLLCTSSTLGSFTLLN